MPTAPKAASKKVASKKLASEKAAAKSGGKKPGLYANIQAKRERIAHGSGEHMREPGEEGAPSADAFDKAAAKKSARE